MNRRRLLRIWVKAGLLACAVGFAAVFVYGLFPPGTYSSGDEIDIRGLPEAAARLDAWNGRPVWVIHRSAAQLDGLAGLSGQVLEPGAGQSPEIDNPYRSPRREYGVYLAETEESGIIIRYVEERPSRLDDDLSWHGGFVDPRDGAVFDAAGRRYPTTRGNPLPVPPHRHAGNGVIRLGDW